MKKIIVGIVKLHNEILICDVQITDFLRQLTSVCDGFVHATPRFGLIQDKRGRYVIALQKELKTKIDEPCYFNLKVVDFKLIDKGDYFHVYSTLAEELNKKVDN